MNSVRQRIALIVILSTVATSSLMGFFAVFESRKMMEREIFQKLQYYVSAETLALNAELQKVMSTANSVAALASENYRDGLGQDEKAMKEYIKSLEPSVKILAQQSQVSQSAYVFFEPSLHTGVFDVWYADITLNGEVKRQETFPVEFYDGDIEEKQWYYLPYTKGYAVWTDPYVGTVEADRHITYLSYTVPVYHKEKIIGVAGSDYFFNRFVQRINAIKPYESSYAALIDGEFDVIVHPDFEPGTSLDDLGNPRIDYIKNQMSGKVRGLIEYEWTDGGKKVLVFDRLDNGWYMLITAYRDEVYEDFDKLTVALIVIVMLGVITSALLGYVLSGWLTQRLKELTHVARAIGDGNYDIEMSTDLLNTDDEIGILSSAIDHMKDRQKESWEEIRRINESLETRVQENTQQLVTTNEYLEISLAQIEEQQAELTEVNQALEETIESMRRTQKQLIETEKIAGLAYLVSGISHELNTPIGNGVTLSSYIEKETTAITQKVKAGVVKKSELIEYMESIDTSARSIGRNLETTREMIMHFKALASTKTETVPDYFYPKEYIDLSIKSMKGISQAKRIQYFVSCPPDLQIFGDANSFIQIISQILTNSVIHGFYERDGGTVQVELHVVGGDVVMKLCDDGNGIDYTDLQHIFVPFFTTKLGLQSKGLGLNIAYNLVHQVFNGEIKVESELNSGTCVEIRLSDCMKQKGVDR